MSDSGLSQANSLTVTDIFKEALRLHQSGVLAEAQHGYEKVLSMKPNHVDANALLGILNVQRGVINDGIGFLQRAISLEPKHAFAHNNLGFAYHERGELDRATAHYRAALAINENLVDALNNLGCVLREQKKWDEAEATFGKLLAINAEHAPAYYNLGLISTDRHDWAQAKDYYRHAIARNRNYVEALCNLANILRNEGDFAAALRNYDRALAVKPDFVEALCNKGVALFKMDHGAEAFQLYERALALKPDYPELLCNIGAWHDKMGNRQQAIDFYQRATQLRPDFVDPLCNIAHMLQEEGDLTQALRLCEQALSVQPDARNAHMNRGVVLMKMLRSDEAAREFKYCLQQDPHDVDALLNLGSLYSLDHEAELALDCANRALTVEPRNPTAHWNRAWALLSMGNLQVGWPEYEWGLQTKERATVQKYAYPRWQGEDISTKTILVYAEQGVGDEVLFASCYTDLIKRAKRVIVQCDSRLVALYQRSFPGLQVHGGARDESNAWLKAYEPIDVCVPSGSLPVVLRKTLADFPNVRNYLIADPVRVAFWRHRLAALPSGLRVGFAWRSRLNLALRARYYPKVLECLPILKVAGVQFVNLQYDNCANELNEIQQYGATVHNFSDIDLFNDLDDSVALMSVLDLVIAPSTTTFMLAGAVGTATWQFCPRILEAWRLGQRQYPWLPAVTLYDQASKDDWTPVIANMEHDLRKWAEQRAQEAIALPADAEGGVRAEALALHGRGEYLAAISQYQAWLSLHPQDAEMLAYLGVAQAQSGQLALAEQSLSRAAKLAPTNAEICNNLGFVYQQLGRLDDEIACYRRAVQYAPDLLTSWCNLANALANKKLFSEATACWRHVKQRDGGQTETMYRLAKCLRAMDQVDEARQQLDELLRREPAHADGLEEYGDLYYQRGDFLQADECYEKACNVNSRNANLVVKRGAVAARRGDFAGAYFQYQQAIALDPQCATAHHNCSLAAMALGDFTEGWREWPWRKKIDSGAGFNHSFDYIPLWRGELISGCALLVHGEQGIGDELLFGSCLSTLIEQNIKIVLQCDERLAPLFARSFPGITVHGGSRTESATWVQQLGAIDFQCPIGDLPMYTRRTLKEFPAASGFLRADPVRVAYWRGELAKLGAGPKVGLAWRSHYRNALRDRSYLNLAQLEPALNTPGVVWVSLQYDDCAAEVEETEKRLGVSIYRITDLNLFDQLDEAAALMTALDVVISPEMATYNLAGALGIETWLLLARVPKRAWVMMGSQRMPWYPSVKIFSQATQGDWSVPLAEIAQALRSRVGVSDSGWMLACNTWLQSLVKPDAIVCRIDNDGVEVRRQCEKNGSRGSVDEMSRMHCDVMVLGPIVDVNSALKKLGDNLRRTRPLLLVPMPAPGLDSETGGILQAQAYEWVTQQSLASFGEWGVFCPMIASSSQRPSARFNELLQYYRQMHVAGYTRMVEAAAVHTDASAAFPGNELPDHVRDIRQLIEKTESHSVLDYGAGKGVQYQLPLHVDGTLYPAISCYWHSVVIECYEPALHGRESLPTQSYDGVVCTDVLEHISQQDIPWVIEEVFSHARRFVFASIACYPAMARLPNGENAHVTVKSPEWWKGVVETIAAQYPHVRCLLKFDEVSTDAKAKNH